MSKNRRLRLWAVTLALAGAGLFPRAAFAADLQTVLDGRLLSFDVPPVIENDRTLVPVRGLLEALGATVGWEPSTQTVTATLGTTAVKARIGDPVATVNGNQVDLDLAPRIVESRTLIPLRFFVESLGMKVAWDGTTRTISIDSGRTQLASRDAIAARLRMGQRAVDVATQLLGLPYAWSGISPETGFDCSGLVTYVYKQLGIALPRTSFEMFEAGVPVALADLQPGDLVFYSTYGAGASHVGIYDGNGSFIQAQDPDTGVIRTPLAREWWTVRYLGARRVIR